MLRLRILSPVSVKLSDILFQDANTEMNNLYEWFCANRLSLNANKKILL